MKTLLDVYIENGGDVGQLDSESLEAAEHMIMEYDTIEILQSIFAEDIMFFFWASGGAMWVPNEIRIISKSDNGIKEYAFVAASGYPNDKYGIDIEAFYPVFPTLKTFNDSRDTVADITGIQAGWRFTYIGFGNYLCIREIIANQFMKECTAKADYYFYDPYYRWRRIALSVLKSG